MVYFPVLFPAFMIVMPAFWYGLWCAWTGVRNMTRLLVATLAVLVLFGASSMLLGPERARSTWHVDFWGLGGFFVLLWGFAVPSMRRAFAAVPEAPRAASLRPRRLELFRGAFVLPFVAWAVLVVLLALDPPASSWSWTGPVVGLLSLGIMVAVLPLGVEEPEPLGGSDPEALAARYAVFRRRRVLLLYAMSVVLSLLVTAAPLLLSGEAGGSVGAIAGATIGVLGGIFGTWADAQRYLLRLQRSGTEPPR